MAILGIETSCDETAIAVIDSPNKKVLCEALFSQIDLHSKVKGPLDRIDTPPTMLWIITTLF